MPRFNPTPLAHSCRALTYAGALIGRAYRIAYRIGWAAVPAVAREVATATTECACGEWYCSYFKAKLYEFPPGFVRHIEFVFDEGVRVRRVDRQTRMLRQQASDTMRSSKATALSVCRPINSYLTPGAKHSKHSFLEC